MKIDLASPELQQSYLTKILGLVVIDMDARIRFVNDQCAGFFGYPNQKEKLLGKRIQDIFPETRMLQNLAPSVTEPQIVFYKSEKGIGISTHVPLMKDGVKIGLMEYDLIHEETAFYELTDKYNAFLTTELNEVRKRLEKLEGSKYTIDNLIGSSPLMVDLKQQIRTVARSSSTVLIQGETGTGKELVAHAIHNLSRRRAGTFAKINASAFPENLVESELFGYEKGAFTGANKNGKIGKFEYANHGTLLIDEIHQMATTIQPKLLRALQEHEIEPIGSNRAIPVDVRIIAAANVSLEDLVRQGKFREDLYYRLNVVTIELPPLRKHLEDLEELSYYHLRQLNKELGLSIRGIDADAMSMLHQYAWPGNVRELKNVLERAMNFATGETLTKNDFAFLAARRTGMLPKQCSGVDLIKETRNKAERDLILATLRHFNNNKTQTAKYLNISRSLLYQKLHRLGIQS